MTALRHLPNGRAVPASVPGTRMAIGRAREQLVSDGPLRRRLGKRLALAMVAGGSTRDGIQFDGRFFDEPETQLLLIGAQMEDAAQLVQLATEEAKKSRDELANLLDDVAALSDVVQPALIDMVKRLRESRMAALNEVRDVVTALRELNTALGIDIDRLTRVVQLVESVEALRKDGTLAALAKL